MSKNKIVGLIVTMLVIGIFAKYQTMYNTILDEVYFVTQTSMNRNSSVFSKIPEIKDYKRMYRTEAMEFSESYNKDSLPGEIDELVIMFSYPGNHLSVSVGKRITSEYFLIISGNYSTKDSIVKTEVIVSEETEFENQYLKERNAVSKLKELGVTSDDIADLFNEGFEEVFLKDWIEYVSGRFKRNPLKNLEIDHQWKQYFDDQFPTNYFYLLNFTWTELKKVSCILESE